MLMGLEGREEKKVSGFPMGRSCSLNGFCGKLVVTAQAGPTLQAAGDSQASFSSFCKSRVEHAWIEGGAS